MPAPSIHHVAILARDVDAEVARYTALGFTVARDVEVDVLGVRAVFLAGAGDAQLEIYTYLDADRIAAELGDAPARLDHIALQAPAADGLSSTLAAGGARFRALLGGEESDAPIELGGNANRWTIADSTGHVALQVIETPSE